MGHQGKEMDVESLQSSGRRRGSCLDICLIASVIFLFLAVTAVAAGGVLVVLKLQSELQDPRLSVGFETPQQRENTPDPAYKMQNFAYVEALSSNLTTSTMTWTPVNYAAGRSVGSNFLFEQHSLKAKRVGTYFIYLELNLTCTSSCDAGLLSVRVGNELTCEVELPADSSPVSRKCWTVSQLNGHKLVAQMTVPKKGLKNWKLELSGSGFGMFLVD